MLDSGDVRFYRQADGSYRAFCTVVRADGTKARGEAVDDGPWSAVAGAIRRAEAAETKK